MAKNDLVKALAQVNPHRRGFLTAMLVGSAAVAAIPMMTTQVMAQKEGEDPKDGKCDGDLVVSKKTGKCAVKKKKAD